MMRIEDVRERLDKRPFEPFRICLTDGRTYDVRNPDLCILGRSTVHVGVPDPKLKRVALRVDQCALVQIVQFEPLNGAQKRKQRTRKGKKG